MTAPFLVDRRGSIAVFTALGFTALLAVAAIGVDYGSMIVARRKAQGAVDLAATLAAADPGRADAVARKSLADNGYAAESTITVQAGLYAGDAKLPVEARFVSAPASPSAVRVDLLTQTPTFFAPALGFKRDVQIGVSGTAASARFASISIGSGLLRLDAGIVNGIFGALLGKPVALSAMDYDALASLRIDSFGILDALQSSLDLKVANYTDVITANATLGQVLSALQTTANATTGGGPAAMALAQLAAAARTATGSVPIGQIIDLGDAASLAPGSGTQGPSVGLMDILSEAIQVANGNRQVSVDLGASVPGLLRTQLTLGIGERRQSSGYVQPGSPKASVTTAQTRLLVEASLTLPLNLGSLTLPLYVQVATARASLRSVTCPWTDRARRQVVVDAQTGVADLAVADIPKVLVDPGARAPDLSQPATLLRVTPLLTVSGGGRVTVGSPAAQALTFSDDDISRHTIRSVSASGLTQSLTAGLIGDLDLQVNGQSLLGAVLIKSTVATALAAVTPALDKVLDNTLRILGIRLGYADLSVDGTRCDQAVLVQ
ncbi:TadG family pilus assembly protein [Methylobacterium sp. J-068]|uniref:TadG family pilus assembly protein n=1 Tax=Methylobacterium sp. J-068 TaxID=2836649 RepID=UPI001FBBDE1B|nr:TadG family pilus assembly protein [Methylobacterium sp. J-068]MCJ2033471.1 pilus assembly protein TadG-related protein [Methylobacterium sp. J-068]